MDSDLYPEMFILFLACMAARGGAVVELLRYRKVADLIPDCVTGIFYSHNPSGRTMVMGPTQPLTEMSTRITSWE
jgi:hypothetical protein